MLVLVAWRNASTGCSVTAHSSVDRTSDMTRACSAQHESQACRLYCKTLLAAAGAFVDTPLGFAFCQALLQLVHLLLRLEQLRRKVLKLCLDLHLPACISS